MYVTCIKLYDLLHNNDFSIVGLLECMHALWVSSTYTFLSTCLSFHNNLNEHIRLYESSVSFLLFLHSSSCRVAVPFSSINSFSTLFLIIFLYQLTISILYLKLLSSILLLVINFSIHTAKNTLFIVPFPQFITFLPCLALPCLALPCLALPCLTLPYQHSDVPFWHDISIASDSPRTFCFLFKRFTLSRFSH